MALLQKQFSIASKKDEKWKIEWKKPNEMKPIERGISFSTSPSELCTVKITRKRASSASEILIHEKQLFRLTHFAHFFT